MSRPVARRRSASSTTATPSVAARIEELADLRALRPALTAALEQLPAGTARAVALRVTDELPYAEVAQRLGCSEGAARVRVTRGIHRHSAQRPARGIERRRRWRSIARATGSSCASPTWRRPRPRWSELQAVGIDAEIRLVPVTAPLVGRWACLAEFADGDPAGPDLDGAGPNGASYVVRLEDVEYTPRTIRIRRDFAQGPQDGELVFVAGRAAGSGERASADPCRDTVLPPRRGAPGRP